MVELPLLFSISLFVLVLWPFLWTMNVILTCIKNKSPLAAILFVLPLLLLAVILGEVGRFVLQVWIAYKNYEVWFGG